MERLVFVHQVQDPINQFLPPIVSDLPEKQRASQMIVTIGITTRTGERALPSYLDGKRWSLTCQDLSPGLNYVARFHRLPSFLFRVSRVVCLNRSNRRSRTSDVERAR